MAKNKTRKLKKLKQKGRGIAHSTLNILRNIVPSKEKDFLRLLLKPRTTIAELEVELEKGADVNALIKGLGFLHYLVNDDVNNEKIEFLLDNEADINIKDNNGFTPLMLASMHVATENLKTLIERRANLEEKDKTGATAMWLAAYYGMVDNTLVLKNAGANGDVCNNDGKCAIDVFCDGDPAFDLEDEEWVEDVYSEVQRNLCRAGARADGVRGEVCDAIRAEDEQQRRILERLAAMNVGRHNIPEMNIGSVHLPKTIVVDEKTGRREPISNAISWEPIENGNSMVNFHDEMKAKRFYKKASFNEYAKNRYYKGLDITNPYNPSRKINTVRKYTAKIRNHNTKK